MELPRVCKQIFMVRMLALYSVNRLDMLAWGAMISVQLYPSTSHAIQQARLSAAPSSYTDKAEVGAKG